MTQQAWPTDRLTATVAAIVQGNTPLLEAAFRIACFDSPLADLFSGRSEEDRMGLASKAEALLFLRTGIRTSCRRGVGAFSRESEPAKPPPLTPTARPRRGC